MKINYPNPLTKTKDEKKISSYSRGMLFEHDLNESNKYYLLNDIAVIYKKPTPIRIVKVDYPSRSKARITEAYYQQASTTDYNGIYKEKYIDYEAKQTDSLSFSFENISPHQIDHLLKIDKHGGIAFVIIYFRKLEKVYVFDIKPFYKLYKDEQGRKSIRPIDIENNGGKEVVIGYAPLINYLKAVDEIYFK